MTQMTKPVSPAITRQRVVPVAGGGEIVELVTDTTAKIPIADLREGDTCAAAYCHRCGKQVGLARFVRLVTAARDERFYHFDCTKAL